MNKYDVFFESIKNILFKLSLIKQGDIEGVSDKEIQIFEEVNNVKYPESMHSFLHYFGKKSNIRRSDDTFDLTLDHLTTALKEARKRNLWQIIDERNFRVDHAYITDGSDKSDQDYIPIKDIMEIENITFFRWDIDRQIFCFFDSTKDNPDTYLFWNNEIYTDRKFLDLFRSSLYLFFVLNAKTHFSEIPFGNTILPPLTDFRGIEWIKDYISIRSVLGYELTSYRNAFYIINDERERERGENRVLTVSEFETDFLNYVRQQGHDF